MGRFAIAMYCSLLAGGSGMRLNRGQFVTKHPYTLIGSETCEAGGYQSITSSGECSEAAQILGLSNETASEGTNRESPTGCYHRSQSSTRKLWFNNNGLSIGASPVRQLICRKAICARDDCSTCSADCSWYTSNGYCNDAFAQEKCGTSCSSEIGCTACSSFSTQGTCPCHWDGDKCEGGEGASCMTNSDCPSWLSCDNGTCKALCPSTCFNSRRWDGKCNACVSGHGWCGSGSDYCSGGTDCSTCLECEAFTTNFTCPSTCTWTGSNCSARATWTVSSGKCKVVDGTCVTSPNFPQEYGNRESCKITLSGRAIISAEKFYTESSFDKLYVNNRAYHGSVQGPNNVDATGTISWTTDGSVTKSGWKLCQV